MPIGYQTFAWRIIKSLRLRMLLFPVTLLINSIYSRWNTCSECWALLWTEKLWGNGNSESVQEWTKCWDFSLSQGADVVQQFYNRKETCETNNLKSNFRHFTFKQSQRSVKQSQRSVKSIYFGTVHQERSFGKRRKFFHLKGRKGGLGM